jgi:hypothetical protein
MTDETANVIAQLNSATATELPASVESQPISLAKLYSSDYTVDIIPVV